MRNLRNVVFASLLISGFLSLNLISDPLNVNAIPRELLDKNFIFGPISGEVENENGTTEWIIVGNWRTSLTNDTNVQNNETSNAFNAAIDMIRSDGTTRHTHTLTEFKIIDMNTDNNSTFYNGTSTISLREGPALDIPTSIQKFNDQVFVIKIDPESVDNHFGNSAIYGVVADPYSKRTSDSNMSNPNIPSH